MAISFAVSRTLLAPVPLAVRRCIAVLMALGMALTAQDVLGSGPQPVVHRFLQSNCLDCHEGEFAEAGLDLATLSEDLSDPQVITRWARIFDRVAAGEMPPEDVGEIDAKQRDEFLRSTEHWLEQTQQDEFARLGRVRARRLTNLQLERSLHDLLAVDVPLRNLMPDEPRTDGFTNIAEGQAMSHFQLDSHLSAIDAALDAAFERAADRRKSWSRDYTPRQIARSNPERRCRDPEKRDGLAVTWSSRLIFYGRISSTTVPRSGWYRITLTASAVKKPEEHGVWCTIRSGRCTSGAPLMSWIGAFEATDQPKEVSYDAWIPKGHMLEIRPGDATLKMGKFRGGQVGVGEGEPQDLPGVAMHAMRLEEIHPGGDVGQTRQALFGELDVGIDVTKNTFTLLSGDPAAATTDQLSRFAQRAFRRPVDEDELNPYLDRLQQLIAEGQSPVDALRASYRAVLCSPRFIYFSEPAGPLDDFAIASRLSYMLWNRMPDQRLLRLAEAGRLRNQDVLRQQVQRMLADPRGDSFISDFTGQWLDLVEIGFTEPDRKLYRDFDPIVQDAMLKESHAFIENLLQENAPAIRLIDSNHTFLNSRLARFYEIDGVNGEELRRIELPDDSPRGGLLSQGAILKVTANGTNTSPVLRGVWVSERLLGETIPSPPASVAAVEPDIRGAKTIREMLAKHQAEASCASCHKTIDPPGYALESFDAAGRWREKYRRIDGSRVRPGAKIDPSFVMADGREFDDFHGFCKLLADDPRPIARNFAEKLMVYGTGARISFADRDVIDRIVEKTADDHYGLRSLLHAVVSSPTFLSK